MGIVRSQYGRANSARDGIAVNYKSLSQINFNKKVRSRYHMFSFADGAWNFICSSNDIQDFVDMFPDAWTIKIYDSANDIEISLAVL